MTNVPKSNFPAFDWARDYLKSYGHTVISPADHDRELGITESSTVDAKTLKALAEWDLDAVMNCDAVYMLPNWENSKGARAEHAVANWLGKQIMYSTVTSGL